MRSKNHTAIESQKNIKNHKTSMKIRCEKYWEIQSVFIEKRHAKICDFIVFPSRRSISEKSEFRKGFLFRKFDPKLRSKRRNSKHRKINHTKKYPNGVNIHKKSMKNPSENRSRKKLSKIEKMEARSAEGSTTRFRDVRRHLGY